MGLNPEICPTVSVGLLLLNELKKFLIIGRIFSFCKRVNMLLKSKFPLFNILIKGKKALKSTLPPNKEVISCNKSISPPLTL